MKPSGAILRNFEFALATAFGFGHAFGRPVPLQFTVGLPSARTAVTL
jgi:hypothetical protein